MKPILDGMLPTPVYINFIDRNFTKDEIQFFADQSNKCLDRPGNRFTKNTYILNCPEMSGINEFVKKCVNDYVDKIIKPIDDINVYITQSWINYTDQNGFHPKHSHPNSYISGVLYLSADENKDKISFGKSEPEAIAVKRNLHKLNSPGWWYNVRSGMMIMFPSSTIHEVKKVEGDHTRISLSFNTFIKGNLGNVEGSLMKLII
tara:strand:+ start:43 stop:654 length:612 start_codon:yes stop_codon:yes gene_type:complete